MSEAQQGVMGPSVDTKQPELRYGFELWNVHGKADVSRVFWDAVRLFDFSPPEREGFHADVELEFVKYNREAGTVTSYSNKDRAKVISFIICVSPDAQSLGYNQLKLQILDELSKIVVFHPYSGDSSTMDLDGEIGQRFSESIRQVKNLSVKVHDLQEWLERKEKQISRLNNRINLLSPSPVNQYNIGGSVECETKNP